MVERLNLKLSIDYLPSRGSATCCKPSCASHRRVCAWGGWTPCPRQGLLASHLVAHKDAGAGISLELGFSLLAGKLEPSARLRAPRDSWAEILLSRFG